MACEKPGIPEIPLKFSLKVEIIWESYYNRFSSLLCQSCLTKVTVNCLRDKRLLKALHNSNKCNVYIRGTICLFTAASCWNKFDEICWEQRIYIRNPRIWLMYVLKIEDWRGLLGATKHKYRAVACSWWYYSKTCWNMLFTDGLWK